METAVTAKDLLPAAGFTLMSLVSYTACSAHGGKLRFDKKLLGDKKYSIPYKPWELDIDIFYNHFRAVENIREWYHITFPLVWFFSIFAKHVPIISGIGNANLNKIVLVSGVFYAVNDYLYTVAYTKKPETRLKAFKRRLLMVIPLFLVDFASLGYLIYNHIL